MRVPTPFVLAVALVLTFPLAAAQSLPPSVGGGVPVDVPGHGVHYAVVALGLPGTSFTCLIFGPLWVWICVPNVHTSAAYAQAGVYRESNGVPGLQVSSWGGAPPDEVVVACRAPPVWPDILRCVPEA